MMGVAGAPSTGLGGFGPSGAAGTIAAGTTGAGSAGSAVMPPRAGTGGMGGTVVPPMAGGSGMSAMAGTGPGSGGMGAAAGSSGMGGPDEGGEGGASAGAGGTTGGGACCDDGDCLCHGDPPAEVTSMRGPFATDSFSITAGTVYYPTDAEPPFAGVALCGGFLNTGPEMEGWGPFYASHGIVTVITWTGAADTPDIRAVALLGAIEGLKGENTKSGSPLMGKLAGRYGTSGYSMGGGGTTIASGEDATLKTSVGLAPWAPIGAGIQVATLLLCGDADTVAPCSMAQSSYGGIPDATPKMMISISGATHFNWFGPGDAGRGTSGAYALAFQKVFLEGDERWRPLLLGTPSAGRVTTNVK